MGEEGGHEMNVENGNERQKRRGRRREERGERGGGEEGEEAKPKCRRRTIMVNLEPMASPIFI